MEACRREWAKQWLKTEKTSLVGEAWTNRDGISHAAVNPTNREILGTFCESTPGVVNAAVEA